MHIINPGEFLLPDSVGEGKLEDLEEQDEATLAFELCAQMKQFFIQRNFEGKSIFKVLSKQISHLPDVNMLPAELTAHLLELGFLASFMCKE